MEVYFIIGDIKAVFIRVSKVTRLCLAFPLHLMFDQSQNLALLLFATWKFVARGGGSAGNKQFQLAKQYLLRDNLQKNVCPYYLAFKYVDTGLPSIEF